MISQDPIAPSFRPALNPPQAEDRTEGYEGATLPAISPVQRALERIGGEISAHLFQSSRLHHLSTNSTVAIVAIAALAGWYAYTGKSRQAERQSTPPLPHQVAVLSSSPGIANSTEIEVTLQKDGRVVSRAVPVKYFSLSANNIKHDFRLETERYRIVKREDILFGRIIGHVASVPTKLFFWDGRVGAGLDTTGVREVVSMLERDKDIHGVMVRINHADPIGDCGRLFTDPQVVNRNPLLVRVVLGVPTVILGEGFSAMRRGDYYNPITNTAVLYSNVPCVAAHELGHHKDFKRFKTDWIYSVLTKIPPAFLYPEWRASAIAKSSLLREDQQWQFKRYLIPAFATYVLAAIAAVKRILFGKKEEEASRQQFSHRRRRAYNDRVRNLSYRS
ncbi:MAG: hypothetical protein K1X83_14640 [Oligoflexia bacterium]|nr:hypothetical protein [Oligoflexia bacterium]